MILWKFTQALPLLLLCLQLEGAVAVDINASAVSIESDVLHFAYELERLLDIDKQPCQDFYGYVCARSANLSQALSEQHRKNEQQRFEQFITAANDEQLLDMELKLKNFYKSCETNRGVVALKNSMLYKSSGRWPALEPAGTLQRSNLTWLALLANFHEVGVSYFFETIVSIKSNKRQVLLQPDITMRHTMRKFEQLVGDVLRGNGVEQSRAPVLALEVLSLERSRREIVKTDVIDDQVEFSYGNFKRTAFGNVSTLAIDWDAYFKKVLGKTLQPSDTIIVKQLPRLVSYFNLLQNTTLQRFSNWLWIDYLMDITTASCQQLAEIYVPDVYAHFVQRASSDRAQMAQMYAAIGKAYREQLATTVWIDEMSQRSSLQFLGRVMHLTLNGDERLNVAYRELLIGKRNFYRNLEKLQRFQAQQKQRQQTQPANAIALAVEQYAHSFRSVNMLLGIQNLSAPLNYLLMGEQFSRSLVAAGSTSKTPGAWRSMDSEHEFDAFQNCSARGLEASALARFNTNDLLLGVLAQRQAWLCYKQWLDQEAAQLQLRLNTLLAVGRLKLSLQRLYFIGGQLVDCGQSALQQERKRQLLHAVLRNTPEFSETFNCRPSDSLYTQQRCSVA